MCKENDMKQMKEIFKNVEKIEFVIGGNTRQESVHNALRLVESEYVLLFVNGLEAMWKMGKSVPHGLLQELVFACVQDMFVWTKSSENFKRFLNFFHN